MLTYTAQSKWNFEDSFYIINVMTQITKEFDINPGSYEENSFIYMKIIQNILNEQKIPSELKEIKNIQSNLVIGYGLDCVGSFWTPMGMNCPETNVIFSNQENEIKHFRINPSENISKWDVLIQKITEQYEQKFTRKNIDFSKIAYLSNKPNNSFCAGIAFEFNEKIIQQQHEYIEKLQAEGKNIQFNHQLLNSHYPKDVDFCIDEALSFLQNQEKNQPLPSIVKHYQKHLKSLRDLPIFSRTKHNVELIGRTKLAHYFKIPVNLSSEEEQKNFLSYLSWSHFSLFMTNMSNTTFLANFFKKDIFPYNKTSSGLICTQLKKQPNCFITSREDIPTNIHELEEKIGIHGGKEVGRVLLFEKEYDVKAELNKRINSVSKPPKPTSRF